ncbi:GNAT family N-acetyltransferase [Desulfurispora thermophila]|uniref:GNAT family N-acetyltransferase n=1 Tax=Desulfurispora thermophila TaxID=265470 RepID=UPI0012EA57F7|nr:GNAT family N-acetyltransferase [Desulfurispora thermophila]
MQITVTPVRSFSDLVLFCRLPYLINNDRSHMAALSPEDPVQYLPASNPTLSHIDLSLYIAWQDKKPVGRISASYDRLNPRRDVAFFGSLICQNSPTIMRALLRETCLFAARHKCNILLGPATFNTNQQVGLLIEGFIHGPQYMLPYNPPYYQQLLEECGLIKEADLLTFSWSAAQGLPDRIREKAARALKNLPTARVRTVNAGNIFQEARIINEIFNQSMNQLWGYIPVRTEETLATLHSCLQDVHPSLQLVLEVEKEPVGVLLFFPAPSPTRPGIKSVRAGIMGIVPSFRKRGLDAILIKRAIELFLQLGYDEADLSQVHENNLVMLNLLSKTFQLKQTRRYRVYACPLESHLSI